MTFRAMMLQGRLALHLEPDLLELDLEHCDSLANQYVEHTNRKRDMVCYTILTICICCV